MSEIFSPQEKTLLLALKCFNGRITGIKRLQKLIFLSQHTSGITDEGKFIFAPYLRGPFSTDCMDTLTGLSQKGYVQIKRISDERFHGYHVVQLTEKGRSTIESFQVREETRALLNQFDGTDTDSLTEASYREFYRSIKPTMLYVNTPSIDDVTCYPSSPHWRSGIGERIKLSVPIGKTAALDGKEVEKLERIRDIAAVFTSTKQILSDWKVRKLVPGCIIRTYGVFHEARQTALGLVGSFSHSAELAQDNVIQVAIDPFGKIFFVDEGAETLMSYVVELCGEISVSVAYPVINALYVLGYEVLSKMGQEQDGGMKNAVSQNAKLGFRRADENFDVSSMFT
jgi:hypothetical protein